MINCIGNLFPSKKKVLPQKQKKENSKKISENEKFPYNPLFVLDRISYVHFL
ncbi:hypothetical protein ACFL2K_02340 [Candidatus Margulisiibacteriota bacterium]